MLNVATVTGFSLVGAIVSGQTIASVKPSANISVGVGIGITCAIGFGTALLGYRVIHLWQRWQWIPNLIAILIAVGYGGKELRNQTGGKDPTVREVLSFGSLMAGYFMTFGGTVSDFATLS